MSSFVARIRRLDDRSREFEFVEDALSDALTVAENTTGSTTLRRFAEDQRETSPAGKVLR
jgi:hypothetical protein